MGTRADFYVGRGPEAEWLGSISWDGHPGSLGHEHYTKGADVNPFGAETEQAYREQIALLLSLRDDATLATEFWPWPWEDSRTTDYAYAFEGGKVYASSFGHPWFEVDLNAENCGEPEDTEKDPSVVFPDMSARMGSHDQIMASSGLISVASAPDGRLAVHAHSRKDLDGPEPRYAAFPDHPLAQVPLAALEAAREAYRLAFRDGSAADETMIEPIADAVLMAALPHLKEG